MSRNDSEGMSIKIMGKEYLIACPDEERKELEISADYLDKKMREIRDTGKVIGTDRIAVMAALNIAHELLNESGGSELKISNDVEGRIKGIQEKIEDALFRSRQLELEA